MVSFGEMTEKRKPTYDLEAFKAAFASVDRLNVTGVALRNAAGLGFGRDEIMATIQTMQRRHFYKSMTAYADHRVFVAVVQGERQWLTIQSVPKQGRPCAATRGR